MEKERSMSLKVDWTDIHDMFQAFQFSLDKSNLTDYPDLTKIIATLF